MIKTWAGATASVVMILASGQVFAQSGDANRGQRLFNQQCRACHTVEKDGATLVGPNLHGVFGRKAGTAAGYSFSEAMTKSGIVWDDTTLAEYNRDPKGRVPGTKMMFNGVKQAGQVDDLVVYLKEATK
jgi:cytochrome c